MHADDIAKLQRGDRVYRWWDSGAMGSDMQVLAVVRVNRKTVTVRTNQGSQFRLSHADIVGRYTEED